MTVSIYATTPTTWTFLPFMDTISEIQTDPSFCGNKAYTSSDTLATIIPPATLPNTEPWTISAFTNDPLQVGARLVSITASLVSYPLVTPVVVIFTLTVVDDCETALVQNGGQTLKKMSYLPMFSETPTT